MDKVDIVTIIGARPQFIKHAALQSILRSNFNEVCIHTGQHYDTQMSEVFFDKMNLFPPDYSLNAGSASHGRQTSLMLEGIESILLEIHPKCVLVYGDTNSTLAGTLAAVKLQIPVAHVEAGLRSFNRAMPEEINRIVTDTLSTLLFCSSETAAKQLSNEGITNGVHVVGDVMRDVLTRLSSDVQPLPGIPSSYYYLTLHRPYNTDNEERLRNILNQVNALPHPVYFSCHPRTRVRMEQMGLMADNFQNIVFLAPQGYLENLALLRFASRVITDSGGLQKEAYWLKKPCVTLRSETEWVETLEGGWNQLLFEDLTAMPEALVLEPALPYHEDLYGDGNAADRIVAHLSELLG